MTIIWIVATAAGVLALAVIAQAVRRGVRRGIHKRNEILSIDASERTIRRAENQARNRQKGAK